MIHTDAVTSHLTILPIISERWADLEALFGEQGAVGGCWCMWWRLSGREYAANSNADNREAFKTIVESGHVPGLLAYSENRAIAWCSIAPREEYSARFNNRSPMFKPVDDLPVWSIVCFFIHPDYRRQGVARVLLDAAIAFAVKRGASIIEAYPKETVPERMTENFLYTGTLQMYRDAGFKEVTRRQTTMTLYIMRLILNG
jgi:GNAT superfamily N-acetyltransferase